MISFLVLGLSVQFKMVVIEEERYIIEELITQIEFEEIYSSRVQKGPRSLDR